MISVSSLKAGPEEMQTKIKAAMTRKTWERTPFLVPIRVENTAFSK
jgi:hypothetical protein